MTFLTRPKAHTQMAVFEQRHPKTCLHSDFCDSQKSSPSSWCPGCDTHSPVGIRCTPFTQQCRGDHQRPRPALQAPVPSELPVVRTPGDQLLAVTASSSGPRGWKSEEAGALVMSGSQLPSLWIRDIHILSLWMPSSGRKQRLDFAPGL